MNSIDFPSKILLREFPHSAGDNGANPIAQLYDELGFSSADQSKALCVGHATTHLSSAASVGMNLLPVGTKVVFEHSKTIKYNDDLDQALQFIKECLMK